MMRRLKGWLQGRARAPGAAPRPELAVLMVCTGNICRSPTAEAVLRERLHRAGLAGRVFVDSAGTQGYHTGEAPDPRAVRAGRARGYALEGLRARPVVPEDFERFDWLLAMDQGHLDWLQRKAPPGGPARISLLMPFGHRHPGVDEVPDPYYGAPAGFERVLDLVEDACDGLLPQLRHHLAGGPLGYA